MSRPVLQPREQPQRFTQSLLDELSESVLVSVPEGVRSDREESWPTVSAAAASFGIPRRVINRAIRKGYRVMRAEGRRFARVGQGFAVRAGSTIIAPVKSDREESWPSIHAAARALEMNAQTIHMAIQRGSRCVTAGGRRFFYAAPRPAAAKEKA